MAAVVGSGCGLGVRGTSRGGRGGAEGCRDGGWRWWGLRGGFVEQMMCLDEHACSSLRDSVFWAVDHRPGLLLAWVAVFKVTTAVWMLDEALVVVFWPFAAGVAAVVGSDVAVVTGGSGCGTGGWGLCWSVVGQPGSQCHCSRGAGACFEAGEGAVVAVVDSDDSADGGCAGIVSSDVADSGGSAGVV